MCDVIEITGAATILAARAHWPIWSTWPASAARLATLTAQLNAIPGVVEDGAFFLREDSARAPASTRLAPWWLRRPEQRRRLSSALRQRIDPVFLPRPLLLVEQLPRNATGKLPQQALQGLADHHLKRSDVT